MQSRWAIRAHALGLLLAALVSGCVGQDHPPPPVADTGSAGKASLLDGGIFIDGSITGGPPTCGGKTLQAILHPPLLYFVIDRSGSMGDVFDESGVKKYPAALTAIGNLLDAIGGRVRYGAAIYPATDIDSSCEPGFQLFPPTLGDAPSGVAAGKRGPILRELMTRLSGYKPGGATPTSATLSTLAPKIASYGVTGDPTFVLLVTDGAPNCNLKARCDTTECIPDIEGVRLQQGSMCGRDISCCDPSLGSDAGSNCIDGDASEKAVQDLFDANVRTFVIGMPGSEAYARTLDRLAVAGGTARPTMPHYYAVSDAAALQASLLEIGTSVAISCDVELEQPPSDPALVNVYFDGELVPRDAEHGWDYRAQAGLSLLGDACRTLQSGGVREVQITYGCQTIVR